MTGGWISSCRLMSSYPIYYYYFPFSEACFSFLALVHFGTQTSVVSALSMTWSLSSGVFTYITGRLCYNLLQHGR
ncbi:hypothetical protein EDD18DRAFT_1191992 [Armillaria luteobubalina]|uniref:Uncharacterized protein n=1 Tax=Armillaria luteobubalina TaxID=153913 RepID=A0AA39TGT0_9AGAR|nr:hypothetical protein EDD18DRAFT_1191992 [Armillaria luteobubalina]